MVAAAPDALHLVNTTGAAFHGPAAVLAVPYAALAPPAVQVDAVASTQGRTSASLTSIVKSS